MPAGYRQQQCATGHKQQPCQQGHGQHQQWCVNEDMGENGSDMSTRTQVVVAVLCQWGYKRWRQWCVNKDTSSGHGQQQQQDVLTRTQAAMAATCQREHRRRQWQRVTGSSSGNVSKGTWQRLSGILTAHTVMFIDRWCLWGSRPSPPHHIPPCNNTHPCWSTSLWCCEVVTGGVGDSQITCRSERPTSLAYLICRLIHLICRFDLQIWIIFF
jgi:hypothetical protein